MIPTIDLNVGDFRLLETDNDLILPVNTEIKLIVSSADVIHC
jgi:cytochrome c oxidase subunit 2